MAEMIEKAKNGVFPQKVQIAKYHLFFGLDFSCSFQWCTPLFSTSTNSSNRLFKAIS